MLADRGGVDGERTLRHVAITGGGSGLGAALAREYAARGSRLTLLGRNLDRLEVCAAACRTGGASRVAPVACDVTDADAMRRALAEADDAAEIDILVANAGQGGEQVLAGPAGETVALARSIFEVNTLGVVHTIAPLVERFLARRRGHIVIVSSLAALEGLPQSPAYAASKAAARIYGHGLRRLLAPHGVRVTVVVPGYIATPMSASLPFHKPFLTTAETAARRIARGVDRGAREIAFPWQLRLLAGLVSVLPRPLADRALVSGDRATRIRR